MIYNQKRTFKNFKQFINECLFLLKNRRLIRKALRNKDISAAFRERLMLSVTSVNNCRYCSYYHTRLALEEGISPDESKMLLEGVVDQCPQEEAAALLYAQHWAESDGYPEQRALDRMNEIYGKETAADINRLLQMIRMGNYLGNVLDIVLGRLQFWNKRQQ